MPYTSDSSLRVPPFKSTSGGRHRAGGANLRHESPPSHPTRVLEVSGENSSLSVTIVTGCCAVVGHASNFDVAEQIELRSRVPRIVLARRLSASIPFGSGRLIIDVDGRSAADALSPGTSGRIYANTRGYMRRPCSSVPERRAPRAEVSGEGTTPDGRSTSGPTSSRCHVAIQRSGSEDREHDHDDGVAQRVTFTRRRTGAADGSIVRESSKPRAARRSGAAHCRAWTHRLDP